MTRQQLQDAIDDAGRCLHVLAFWPGPADPRGCYMRKLGIEQAWSIIHWAEAQLKQRKDAS